MITAVDTNILLDILIPDQVYAESSRRLLDHHLASGRLIIGEIVFTELAACFPGADQLEMFLTGTGIELIPANKNTLRLAGQRWAEYTRTASRIIFQCNRCSHTFTMPCPNCNLPLAKRFPLLADFLIGAHALLQANGLLSREPGIFRKYFPDLRITGSLPAS